MAGEALLRVANVESADGIEEVRDALDDLGIDYEYLRSDPEDSYPQSVYFHVDENAADDVESALRGLSDRRGYDTEILW